MIQLRQIHEYGSERLPRLVAGTSSCYCGTSITQARKYLPLLKAPCRQVLKLLSRIVLSHFLRRPQDKSHKSVQSLRSHRCHQGHCTCQYLQLCGRSHFSLDPACGRLKLPACAPSCLVVGWGSVLRPDREGMARNQLCYLQLGNAYWEGILRSPLFSFPPSTEHIQAGAALLARSCSPGDVD